MPVNALYFTSFKAGQRALLAYEGPNGCRLSESAAHLLAGLGAEVWLRVCSAPKG